MRDRCAVSSSEYAGPNCTARGKLRQRPAEMVKNNKAGLQAFQRHLVPWFPVPRHLFRFLWFAPVAVLLIAISLQFYAVQRVSPDRSPPVLATDIPVSLPGWTYRELPLAETEETRNAVVKTLQFDQFVSRIYQRESTTVTIYAAYWGANKVPPRAVGVHTPDTCWVLNGWTRLSRAHAVPLGDLESAFKPAEYGTYSLLGHKQHVYFWHLVGGKPYFYEQEGMHALTAGLSDMAHFGLNQRQEQFFIRIASNVPFTDLAKNLGYQQLLSALGNLCLRQ